MSSSTVDDKEPTSSPGKAEAEEAEPIAEDNDDLNEENEDDELLNDEEDLNFEDSSHDEDDENDDKDEDILNDLLPSKGRGRFQEQRSVITNLYLFPL